MNVWLCFSATTSLDLAFRQLFRKLDPCETIAIVDFLSPPVVNPLLCALSGARYVCDALCVDHHHCQWRSYKTFYDPKSSAKFIYLPTTRAHYKELGVPKMATNSHDRCCYCNLRRLLSFIEHTHNMCVQQRWWRMNDMGHSAIKSQSRCRSCSWQCAAQVFWFYDPLILCKSGGEIADLSVDTPDGSLSRANRSYPTGSLRSGPMLSSCKLVRFGA